MAKNKDYVDSLPNVLCRADNVRRKFTLYSPKMEQDLLIEFGFVLIRSKKVWGHAENFGDDRGWVFTAQPVESARKVRNAA